MLVVQSRVFENTVFKIECEKEIVVVTVAKKSFSYCFRERCLLMKEFFNETYLLNNADERLKFKRIFQGALVILLFLEFCWLIRVSDTLTTRSALFVCKFSGKSNHCIKYTRLQVFTDPYCRIFSAVNFSSQKEAGPSQFL